MLTRSLSCRLRTRRATSEFNWVGESFADSLSDLLSNKAINVLSNQQRKFIQQRLGVPLSVQSIATSVKVGLQAKASLIVVGDYQLLPAAEAKHATPQCERANHPRYEGRLHERRFIDGRANVSRYQF